MEIAINSQLLCPGKCLLQLRDLLGNVGDRAMCDPVLFQEDLYVAAESASSYEHRGSGAGASSRT